MNTHELSSSSSRRRNIVRGVLAATAGVATLVATGGQAQAAASWQWFNLDNDSYYDAATLDANFNGYVEQMWFDVDNDGRLDTHVWNAVGGDAFLESMTFDMNEDGRWEAWLNDTNQQLGFDYIYLDDNGDGYYDRSGPVTQSQSTSVGVIGGIPPLTAIGQIYNEHQGEILPGRCWAQPIGVSSC